MTTVSMKLPDGGVLFSNAPGMTPEELQAMWEGPIKAVQPLLRQVNGGSPYCIRIHNATGRLIDQRGSFIDGNGNITDVRGKVLGPAPEYTDQDRFVPPKLSLAERGIAFLRGLFHR